MLFRSSFRLVQKNGGYPVNISYRIVPIEYMSVAFEVPEPIIHITKIPAINSGDRYAGDPQKLLAMKSSYYPSLLNPKSISLMYPSSSIIIFSGFKSL